jgi:hypothetical protein
VKNFGGSEIEVDIVKFTILISKFEIGNFICLGFGNVCFEFVNYESASTNHILVQHLFYWFIN